jgi:aryl-alcohol dehydrogenase-like predicted oxidoreductase
MTLEDEFRKLGSGGPRVFPLALGCMGMSGMYGQTDDNESLATIHAALDDGIMLLDTGNFYGMGDNEMLIGRALKSRSNKPLLSVKFGALRTPDGGWTGFDARPASVKNFASEKGISPSQLAIAWVLANGKNIVPVVGARKRTQLSESLGAAKVKLSATELSRIEKAIPSSAVAGTRYDEHQMKMLDSERGKGS